MMSHRGRLLSESEHVDNMQDSLSFSLFSPSTPPVYRLETRSATGKPFWPDDDMELSTKSREAAAEGHSVVCNGWSNQFMASKKHFPDSTRSRVLAGSTSPAREFCGTLKRYQFISRACTCNLCECK